MERPKLPRHERADMKDATGRSFAEAGRVELPAMEDDVRVAVEYVRDADGRRPDVALILGSGLGHLGDAVDEATVFRSSDIPGYPESTVVGHQGRLILGLMEGKHVAIVQGRIHFYEGHDIQRTTFPVRLVRGLGTDRLIVTNAAGGINPLYVPGTIMFIEDHINMAFQNPLTGMPRDGGPRFTDMAEPYDLEWTGEAEAFALRSGVPTRRGVYLWTSGPSYESKAEIRFFGRIGADAVGMSTVPEVLQARNLGMRVLGISTITNAAAGLSESPLNHEEVLTAGVEMREEMETLVRGIVRELA